MKGLDLSKLKKHSSDDRSTTFKHADGHEIRIAHKGLSKQMRAELEKLPHYAEGVDVGKNDDDSMAQAMSPMPQPPPMLARDADTDQPQPSALPPPQQEPVGIPANAADVAMGSLGSAGLQPITTAGTPSPVPDKPIAQPAKTPAQNLKTAPQAPAALPSDLEHGDQPSTRLPSEPKPQSLKDQLLASDQAIMNDLKNGHITPKTYSDLFANSSTLGKIGAIFGLMVSGAGAGLAKQPNMMLEMMNKEIERDLQAQEKSKTNQIDLLKLSQQGRLTNAEIDLKAKQGEMTLQQAEHMKIENKILGETQARMAANRLVLDKLAKQAVDYAPGTKEYAKAQQDLAAISNLVDATNYNLASVIQSRAEFLKAVVGDGNVPEEQFKKQNTYLRATGNAALAEDREKKHVPGVGQAAVNPESSDKNMLRNMEQFDQAVKKVRDWAKEHAGLSHQLSVADRNYGRTQLRSLQSLYREGQGMGTLKGYDIPLLEEEIGNNPMSVINSITNDQKLRAAEDTNRDRLIGMQKSLGLPYQEAGGGGGTIERLDPKTGKTIIYDAKTKKPLRWK